MHLLNRHKYKPVPGAFKTWKCTECGTVRYFDLALTPPRMVWVKFNDKLYFSPDCKHIMHADKV